MKSIELLQIIMKLDRILSDMIELAGCRNQTRTTSINCTNCPLGKSVITCEVTKLRKRIEKLDRIYEVMI